MNNVTINGVTFNKTQKAGRTTVTLDETYFRAASDTMKKINNTLIGTLMFLSKKGKTYDAHLHTYGVGKITRIV